MLKYINNIDDFYAANDHPYRSGEYFYDGNNVMQVPNENEEIIFLIESNEPNTLTYHVNWEDQNLQDEFGNAIPPIYDLD